MNLRICDSLRGILSLVAKLRQNFKVLQRIAISLQSMSTSAKENDLFVTLNGLRMNCETVYVGKHSTLLAD